MTKLSQYPVYQKRYSTILMLGATILWGTCCLAEDPRPNIVILLTDDQGYGDLGIHGNAAIQTPNLDEFASKSVVFDHFYVSPVCAPTRASLLTGRYNYRTGVTDTWKGGATVHQDEYTLAEALRAEGYATGLFGKWHLGDNYPYRPQDQGFEKVLMHPGGGISQPSDIPGNSYFDPVLTEDGVPKKYFGYCMDIYTDAALEFIEAKQASPFFVFLATNTPHTPLQVSKDYEAPYLAKGLPEKTSKIYGMVTNIDDNFQRLLDKLDSLALTNNTIVIFMSDNGPRIFHPTRHRAGLRGEKTDVYEGGIRSPFFLRWPNRFKTAQRIETKIAHIDLMPTLLAAAQNTRELPALLDGRNILPQIEAPDSPWPERTLYLQWHRGYKPSKFRNFAAVSQRYKLLQNRNKFNTDAESVFELYDLVSDPGETTNLAEKLPGLVERMQADYLHWLDAVSSTRGFPAMPAWIGSPKENPVRLTHQDRRGGGDWGNDQYYADAHWPIRILQKGDYRISLDLYAPISKPGIAKVQIGGNIYAAPIRAGKESIDFEPILLDEVATIKLSAWVEIPEQRIGVRFLEIKRL